MTDGIELRFFPSGQSYSDKLDQQIRHCQQQIGTLPLPLAQNMLMQKMALLLERINLQNQYKVAPVTTSVKPPTHRPPCPF